jgi:hypothetical protein
MRPTFRTICAILESHASREYAQRTSGMTAAQAARALLEDMSRARSEQERDQLFAGMMRSAGVYCTGVRDFDKQSDALLTKMQHRDAREEVIRQVSEQSRQGTFWPQERVAQVAQVMLEGAAVQRLNAKMAAHDKQVDRTWRPAREPDAALRREADDRADRRAALAAAFAEAGPMREREPSYSTLRPGDHADMRQALELAWDVHALRDAERDPLDDEQLRNLTDAV